MGQGTVSSGLLGKRARQRLRGKQLAELRLQAARRACGAPALLVTAPTPSPAVPAPPRHHLPIARAIAGPRPPVLGRVHLVLDARRTPAPRLPLAPPAPTPATRPSLEPVRRVVDFAGIARRQQQARAGQRRRIAAGVALVPLALAALVMTGRLGGPATTPDAPSLPQVAAVPPPVAPVVLAPPTKVLPPFAAAPQPHLTPRSTVAAPLAVPGPAAPLPAPPDRFAGRVPLDPRDIRPDPLPEIAVPPPPRIALLPPPAAPVPPPLALPAPLDSPPSDGSATDFGQRLVIAALQQTKVAGTYDHRYVRIAYPMGDVPESSGVCTDVIVRAYRGLGIDLQQLVHEAKLGTGDSNVDHRRVMVLKRFFMKYGQSLEVSPYPESYKPGDIVAYDVPWGRTSKSHIAIVTGQLSASLRPMVVHNRGYGARLEDALFHKRIIGHYRFDGTTQTAQPAATADGKPAPRLLARVAIRNRG